MCCAETVTLNEMVLTFAGCCWIRDEIYSGMPHQAQFNFNITVNQSLLVLFVIVGPDFS